ncbi:MAG: CoA transferase [Acetobacteraceae bacterium]|nr:CoA transferase [Acetobacteraceae bacterium]
MHAETPKPYRGLSVLDASQGIAGPYCATLLAACGADVVKLEPPAGDWARGLSTRVGNMSVMHVTGNRGKRGIVLDLQQARDGEAMRRLAARADVMIEGFRPGVAKRLGFVPEAGKPDVVFLSISGFGQHGPYAERPCTDGVAQAFAGMVALNVGADGVPHRTGPYLTVDMSTGVAAFGAVQAALFEQMRDRLTGAAPRRRVLDVSLVHTAAALLSMNIAEHAHLGEAPKLLNVPAGSYQGGDGRWVMVALLREAEFVQMCGVLDLPDLSQDPRFATYPDRGRNREAILPIIREAFLKQTSDVWIERFQGARMLCDRVNGPLEYLADPHVVASGATAVMDQPGIGPLTFPALPGLGHWTAPAPGLGEHTAEVLAEIGPA